MKLYSLKLENFRGFEDAEITFEPDLTVLVGANGSGKTSLLNAIALARDTGNTRSASDLRFAADSAEVWLGFRASNDHVSACGFRLSRRADGPFLDRENFGDHRRGQKGPGDELLLFYRAARSAVDATPGATQPVEWGRAHAVEGWTDALRDPKLFFHWFKERDDSENEAMRYGDGGPIAELSSVRRAVTLLFPEISELRVRRSFERFSRVPVLTVKKAGVPLPFDALSDGERTWILLVADLARRLALWDLDAEDPLQTEAIVLIDEIEQHVHPAWQRRLLGKLGEVFPNVQFIVTTHSPVVISEVEPRQIRVLKDFKLVPTNHAPGRAVNAVLEDVFETPAREAAAERALETLADMVDDGDPEEAMAFARKLEADGVLDGLDPDLVYYRVLLQRILAS